MQSITCITSITTKKNDIQKFYKQKLGRIGERNGRQKKKSNGYK